MPVSGAAFTPSIFHLSRTAPGWPAASSGPSNGGSDRPMTRWTGLRKASNAGRQAAARDAAVVHRAAVERDARARAAWDVVGAALLDRRAVGAAVRATLVAVGRQRRLADAELAFVARIRALGHLRAGRTLGRVVEVLGRAGRRQPNCVRRPGNQAATEAVAAVRHELPAVVDAGLRLRRRERARVVGVLLRVLLV